MSNLLWLDPRMAVLIIWGISVAIFLCYPGRRAIAKIFHALGIPCCEIIEDDERPPTSTSQTDEDYESLSSARKIEIDSQRSIALLRNLSRFTVTIKRENVLRRDSISKMNLNESRASSDKLKSSDEPQCTENDARVPEDIECSLDSAEHDEKGKIELTDSEHYYTHINIPYPGHATESPIEQETEPTLNLKNQGRTRKFTFNQENGRRNSNINMIHQPDAVKIREVSISCSICLMDYEISERVCYSSNSDCSHVYHEVCIINWFVSLGRTRSKKQSIPADPTDEQLLNYDLECPCCRQEFVCKSCLTQDHGIEHAQNIDTPMSRN